MSERDIIRLRRELPQRRRRIPVALRLVMGLAALALLGTLVLWLVPGLTLRPLTFMEAAFTATSAVTVTGLTVVTTSTQFTLAGQFVILLLIQIGGLGFMFAAVLIFILLGRRVSLLDRLTLSSSLGLDKPSAILVILRRVLIGILVIEGVGALLLYLHWRFNGIVPAENALFYAIFHAVSAFCNAGFDLFDGLARYPEGIPGDSVSLLIMGVLVILGGLGIPVFGDLLYRRRMRRIGLHTRLTLTAVVFLILLGWAGLLISEVQPGGVLQDDPWSTRLVHSWFQSVSTRTAGFPGLRDFDQMQSPARLLVMVLMFIGSAPASMGGGITTGTFAVLGVTLVSYARGYAGPRVNGRSISAGAVRRATAVLTLSLAVVFSASWLILLTHDLEFDTVLFEVVSAFATCGLSLGITDELNTFGRLIIMLMMFWGRLGALTIVIALLQSRPTVQLVQYPEEDVLL